MVEFILMLKDKIVNSIRKNVFKHKKYTDEQIIENEKRGFIS